MVASAKSGCFASILDWKSAEDLAVGRISSSYPVSSLVPHCIRNGPWSVERRLPKRTKGSLAPAGSLRAARRPRFRAPAELAQKRVRPVFGRIGDQAPENGRELERVAAVASRDREPLAVGIAR